MSLWELFPGGQCAGLWDQETASALTMELVFVGFLFACDGGFILC